MKMKYYIEHAVTREDVLRVINYALDKHTDEGLQISKDRSYLDTMSIRVRVMRVYAPLHDIEMWEPEQFTQHDKRQMAVMLKIVENCDKHIAYIRTQENKA